MADNIGLHALSQTLLDVFFQILFHKHIENVVLKNLSLKNTQIHHQLSKNQNVICHCTATACVISHTFTGTASHPQIISIHTSNEYKFSEILVFLEGPKSTTIAPHVAPDSWTIIQATKTQIEFNWI